MLWRRIKGKRRRKQSLDRIKIGNFYFIIYSYHNSLQVSEGEKACMYFLYRVDALSTLKKLAGRVPFYHPMGILTI